MFLIFIVWLVIDQYNLRRPASSRKGSSEKINNNKLAPIKQEIMNLEFEDSNKTFGKYLIFDVETTGLPIRRNAKPQDFSNWPYVVQISWLLFDDEGKCIEFKNHYIKQEIEIPMEAIQIHGITTEMIKEKGVTPQIVYSEFYNALNRTEYLIAHNIEFDLPIIHCELLRNGVTEEFHNKKIICTMKTGTNFCKIPLSNGGYKYPTLTELYQKCFYSDNVTLKIKSMHRANIDAGLTAKCFFRLKELNIIRK